MDRIRANKLKLSQDKDRSSWSMIFPMRDQRVSLLEIELDKGLSCSLELLLNPQKTWVLTMACSAFVQPRLVCQLQIF